MKKFLLLLIGIGAAGVATAAIRRRHRRRPQMQAAETGTGSTPPVPQPQPENLLDLNDASDENLRGLGLEQELVIRIVENRPYRNKLDLISRLIIPEDVYSTIRDRVTVLEADEPVKVA